MNFDSGDIAGKISGLLQHEIDTNPSFDAGKLIRHQTSTGSEVITLDLGGRDKFNITVTRARR